MKLKSLLPAARAALICTLTISAMFAGTTWCVAAPIANYDCTYSAKAGSDVLHVEHCAWSDAAGRIHLKRKYLLALDFDQHGLASVNIAGGWYYLQRDGRLAPVMAMDNWAEPFSDGLARSSAGGKIGFLNRHLALVIPARYDGALPFQNGWAEVCIGCKLTSDGEHSSYAGGRWACIDRHGHEREAFRPGEAGHVCRQDG
jgi:hypothetical protein